MTQGVSPNQAAAWLSSGSFGASVNNPQWPGYKQYKDIFDVSQPGSAPWGVQFSNPGVYNEWATPMKVPDPQGIHRPVIAF